MSLLLFSSGITFEVDPSFEQERGIGRVVFKFAKKEL
jgi:hypothetical protein